MKIAFLGTGLMGGLMCERLLGKSFDLIVWNRTISKTDKLKSLGAEIAASPEDAILKGDLIIIMLSEYNAIIDVLSNCPPDLSKKTFLQMSTIAPGESINLKGRIEKLGGEYLEAPVLGGIAQILEGNLLPMVGSRIEQFEKWKHFLENFGETIVHFGEVGKAASAKLACNQLIASMLTSFSMSLSYVQEMGIDIEKFMTILRPSAYYAPAFDKKLANMIDRDFSKTNFPLKHLLKDVNLVFSELENANINTSSLETVKNILVEGMREGFAEEDYSVLYNIVHKK
ncbi:MAG: NAD(P)-dependent oxidoreductase [bacterium]